MDALNNTIFLWLNAPAMPTALSLTTARILAEYLIALIPLLLIAGWIFGGVRLRKAVLEAAVASLLGLSISMVIGWVWPQPRPFMLGIGHNFLAHLADASFPSDHLTLWWSVASSFWLGRTMRIWGKVLCVAGLPIAWARIYLGVHFPFDMLGAAVLAWFSAWIAYRLAWRYLPPMYGVVLAVQCSVFDWCSGHGRLTK
ncbi:undecaprenyl-diphosphatase [Chromobacterium sphagni]|uniref:Undecaprenyl-diphosphatase n=1 Tax=Chromobacterium sphagni TaxID=1903179 RepID=A0ABX3CAI1_9NEIS|nr:undecaprenyl-diphosphatase [Chromobacterium sphagni]OHX19183.1 undecaprenyl-diphosphatase [Chromobacterium sphagni]